MKKVLIVCSVGGFLRFQFNNINILTESGYEVHCATNLKNTLVKEEVEEYPVKIHQVDFARSPLSKTNIKAYMQLRDLMKKYDFDMVHCHTPIGGLISRLVARPYRKKGTRVFYTAHGFHFCKGAPLLNWLIYYPVEWICSHFTDVLITINEEDYAFAKKRMKAKRISYVPGVGIDLKKFSKSELGRENVRKELGISKDATLLLSIGELNQNKNHETVIRAIKDLKDVWYVIAGQGGRKAHLQSLIDSLGLTDRVKLLGYRRDIRELLSSADVFVMPSFREGLPASLMEAMAMGLPCVVSEIRGSTDLIDENGGDYFNPRSVEECKKAINGVLSGDREKMSAYNKEKVKNFSDEKVNKRLREEYEKIKCSEKIS